MTADTVLGPITLLKMDVECPCTVENPVMGALNGSAFHALVVMMDRLGLKIYSAPVLVGEMEVLLKLGIGGFNLVLDTEVLTSCCVETSLPVQITFLGFRKMQAPLRAASMTVSFGSTVWRNPKVS